MTPYSKVVCEIALHIGSRVTSESFETHVGELGSVEYKASHNSFFL